MQNIIGMNRDEHENRGPSSPPLDLVGALRAVSRYRAAILAASLSGLIIGVFYISFASPHYKATSMVLIDAHKNQLLEKQEVLSDPQLDAGVVDSQVEILKSEVVAKEVISRLGLTKNPEFNGEKKSLLGRFLSLFPMFPSVLGGTNEPLSQSLEQTCIRAIEANLSVKRVGVSYVMEVSFTSLSRDTAADVANEIAEAYVDGEALARFNATKQTAGWLESRIAELKVQATRSEDALQQFKSDNNIIDTSRGLMSQEQLTALNGQLAQAQENEAESLARVQQIRAVLQPGALDRSGTVSDALRSDVINRLRAQFLDLSARERDYSRRYGPEHRTVKILQGQMIEIKRSIDDEMKRLAATYASDYAIARDRTSSIKSSLDSLVSAVGKASKSRVALRDLESSAQAYRTLYDSYLEKFSQATQQQQLPSSDARIITRASPPSKVSYPKAPVVLGGGLLGGALLAITAAVLLESFSTTFKTASQVQLTLGVVCFGVLPDLSRFRGSRGKSAYRAGPGFVLTAPFSRFAETLRHVKVAVDRASVMKARMKVIGFVSALPEEGKSTVAANYAHLLAAAGYKTLLIDCDLRNPGLTRMTLGVHTGDDLVSVFSDGRDPLASVVEKVDGTSLDFLPCRPSETAYDAAQILSSIRMDSLVASLSSIYDYIIVDLAPMNLVADVRAVTFVDAYVLVIQWDRTRKSALSLDTLDSIRGRIIGAVLNRADARLMRHYEKDFEKGNSPYYRGRGW